MNKVGNNNDETLMKNAAEASAVSGNRGR